MLLKMQHLNHIICKTSKNDPLYAYSGTFDGACCKTSTAEKEKVEAAKFIHLAYFQLVLYQFDACAKNCIEWTRTIQMINLTECSWQTKRIIYHLLDCWAHVLVSSHCFISQFNQFLIAKAFDHDEPLFSEIDKNSTIIALQVYFDSVSVDRAVICSFFMMQEEVLRLRTKLNSVIEKVDDVIQDAQDTQVSIFFCNS